MSRHADSLAGAGSRLQQPQHPISFREATTITKWTFHPCSRKPNGPGPPLWAAATDHCLPPDWALLPAPTHVPTRAGTCWRLLMPDGPTELLQGHLWCNWRLPMPDRTSEWALQFCPLSKEVGVSVGPREQCCKGTYMGQLKTAHARQDLRAQNMFYSSAHSLKKQDCSSGPREQCCKGTYGAAWRTCWRWQSSSRLLDWLRHNHAWAQKEY